VSERALEAFRKHLYQTGLSPKVVERDIASAAAFADALADRPEPGSLRDFEADDLREFADSLRSASGTKGKQALTGLTRFLRFLRDTGRVDYDRADRMLKQLRG
jgi:hypothetical protein